MKRTQNEKPLQVLNVLEPIELLEFLLQKNVRKSRTSIKPLLTHKQILVNGKIVTQYNHALNKGDKVEVMKQDQTRKEKRLKGLKIVYEDQYIIVVDKEAGILSVSTDKEKSKTVYGALNEYVQQKRRNGRVFVLHRLDREVSGLMIFAKDQDIQELYQQNWHLLVPNHKYVGVVIGTPEPANGSITSWLTENKNFVVFAAAFDNGGLKAVTHYDTVKSNGRYSLLNFDLETRRKNQIRVQSQELGHPIVGDKKYGAPDSPIKRIALHSQYLKLKHPVSGNMMEHISTIPKLMTQLVSNKQLLNQE